MEVPMLCMRRSNRKTKMLRRELYTSVQFSSLLSRNDQYHRYCEGKTKTHLLTTISTEYVKKNKNIMIYSYNKSALKAHIRKGEVCICSLNPGPLVL